MYDAANFVTDGRTNERTNEQGDSRSLMVGPSQSVRGPWDDIICFLKGMTMGNGKVEKVDPVQKND